MDHLGWQRLQPRVIRLLTQRVSSAGFWHKFEYGSGNSYAAACLAGVCAAVLTFGYITSVNGSTDVSSGPPLHKFAKRRSVSCKEPERLEGATLEPDDEYMVTGLQNAGNNCFLNVILQALASSRAMVAHMAASCEGITSAAGHSKGEHKAGSQSETAKRAEEEMPLARALAELLAELAQPVRGRQVASPRRVMRELGRYAEHFDLAMQQDALEALSHLAAGVAREQQRRRQLAGPQGSLGPAALGGSERIRPAELSLGAKPMADSGFGSEGKEELTQSLHVVQGSLRWPLEGTLGSLLECQVCGHQYATQIQFCTEISLSPPTQRGGAHIAEPCSVHGCLARFTDQELISAVDCVECAHRAAVRSVDALRALAAIRGGSLGAVPMLGNKTGSMADLEVLLGKVSQCQQEEGCGCAASLAAVGLSWKRAFSTASKRMLLGRAPQVLCLQIQRLMVTETGQLKKLQGHVSFPRVLDLHPFTLAAYATREAELAAASLEQGLGDNLGSPQGGAGEDEADQKPLGSSQKQPDESLGLRDPFDTRGGGSVEEETKPFDASRTWPPPPGQRQARLAAGTGRGIPEQPVEPGTFAREGAVTRQRAEGVEGGGGSAEAERDLRQEAHLAGEDNGPEVPAGSFQSNGGEQLSVEDRREAAAFIGKDPRASGRENTVPADDQAATSGNDPGPITEALGNGTDEGDSEAFGGGHSEERDDEVSEPWRNGCNRDASSRPVVSEGLGTGSGEASDCTRGSEGSPSRTPGDRPSSWQPEREASGRMVRGDGSASWQPERGSVPGTTPGDGSTSWRPESTRASSRPADLRGAAQATGSLSGAEAAGGANPPPPAGGPAGPGWSTDLTEAAAPEGDPPGDHGLADALREPDDASGSEPTRARVPPGMPSLSGQSGGSVHSEAENLSPTWLHPGRDLGSADGSEPAEGKLTETLRRRIEELRWERGGERGAGGRGRAVLYGLVSVVVHQGGATSGHYTVYRRVRRPIRGWETHNEPCRSDGRGGPGLRSGSTGDPRIEDEGERGSAKGSATRDSGGEGEEGEEEGEQNHPSQVGLANGSGTNGKAQAIEDEPSHAGPCREESSQGGSENDPGQDKEAATFEDSGGRRKLGDTTFLQGYNEDRVVQSAQLVSSHNCNHKDAMTAELVNRSTHCSIDNKHSAFDDMGEFYFWVSVSDSHVRRVTQSEVFAADASLLFYERLPPSQPPGIA